MFRNLAILLIGGLFCLTAHSEDRPIVLRVIDAKTSRESGALSDTEVDEIVRFVKTLPVVDHRVQEVDGTSPPQVLVHTGASRGGHGDLLRIEKRHGHWTFVSRSKWKFVGLIESNTKDLTRR
jgi:hypothetical protein